MPQAQKTKALDYRHFLRIAPGRAHWRPVHARTACNSCIFIPAFADARSDRQRGPDLASRAQSHQHLIAQRAQQIELLGAQALLIMDKTIGKK